MVIFFSSLFLGVYLLIAANVISKPLHEIAKEKKRANDIKEKELSS